VRIDAHHHLWDLAVRDQPWTRDLPTLRRSFTAADLRPALDRNAVDATVVVQTIAVPEETPELLALAAQDPHIRAVVGWTSLTDTEGAVSDLVAKGLTNQQIASEMFLSTHTVALVLALERGVAVQDRLVRADRWGIHRGGVPRRTALCTAGIVTSETSLLSEPSNVASAV